MFKFFLLTILAISSINHSVLAGPGHEDGHNHNEVKLVITPITPSNLKAGEENEVVLFIQDQSAKPVDVSQFEVVHTKPVHLLIIDPYLLDYHHEHPVQKATGQYTFNFTPQTACSYRIWADVQLKDSHQQYIPIDLEGTQECKEPVDQSQILETSSQGYEFKLELDGDVKVGEAVMTKLYITKNGKPVDFLEPVMGAFAHMVGFYEDYETIAHIHPMNKEPIDNKSHGAPSLSFHIEPEIMGYLKLFAQVQIGGKQIYAPFSIIVK